MVREAVGRGTDGGSRPTGPGVSLEPNRTAAGSSAGCLLRARARYPVLVGNTRECHPASTGDGAPNGWRELRPEQRTATRRAAARSEPYRGGPRSVNCGSSGQATRRARVEAVRAGRSALDRACCDQPTARCRPPFPRRPSSTPTVRSVALRPGPRPHGRVRRVTENGTIYPLARPRTRLPPPQGERREALPRHQTDRRRIGHRTCARRCGLRRRRPRRPQRSRRPGSRGRRPVRGRRPASRTRRIISTQSTHDEGRAAIGAALVVCAVASGPRGHCWPGNHCWPASVVKSSYPQPPSKPQDPSPS